MSKNFDLSEYSSQTKDSNQASNGKYSAFVENEETKEEANEVIEQNVPEEKEKRVNMAFTDKNYELIVSETNKLGVNFMHFLNHLINSTNEEEIDQFLDKQPLRRGRGSAPRRRGNRLKRINFKINTENHEKLEACASKNDATITTIVNVILEIYANKNNININ